MPANDGDVFTLGHSPDPDDAFMFYAMAENKIDLRGYRFEHRLEDIQTLNERALRGELHISAISIHAFAYVSDRYALMPCGASMGDGYGPMVVTAEEKVLASLRRTTKSGPGSEIGDRVPGADDERISRVATLSRRIRSRRCPFRSNLRGGEDRESRGGPDHSRGPAHLRQAGFNKVVDLGEWWKRETGLPLPLGGNVLRKDIAPAVQRDLLEIMQESIDFGLAHRDEAVKHSMPYARDMDTTLAGKFIGMYVNDYTRDYGETGRRAVREFLQMAQRRGYLEKTPAVEFVE